MVIISTISKYEKFRNIGLPQNISWHQRRYCRQICLWLIKWLFEVYNEIVICHYNNIYINITPINLFPYYKQWMIIILHILKFNCNHANQLKLVDQGWPTIERLTAVFFLWYRREPCQLHGTHEHHPHTFLSHENTSLDSSVVEI